MAEFALLRRIESPPSLLVESACRHIVGAHAVDIPDLSRLTLLVPHLQARAYVAGRLRDAARVPVLLLPRIATLRQWAEDIPLQRPVVPGAAREALLYQALSARGWFGHADLWAIAAELANLLDELTRWHVGMPASLADFRARLERAYRAQAGASFDFEARMVHELWHALVTDTARLDAEAAYQLRLGMLAAQNRSPIYAIGLTRLPPSERQFFERCAAQVPVTVFDERHEAMQGCSPLEHVLGGAWPESITAPLTERAAQLRSSVPVSPLCERLTFFGAHGIEQEARAVDLLVREWLQRGKQSIAVVVFDRLTARRARALLERAQVLVRDEAGWAFSTTSAATVLSRWFDACGNDFYHRDLLDLLKSPFAFATWGRARRQAAVWQLEHALRRESVRTGIASYLALTELSRETDGRAMLLALQEASRVFDVRRRKSLPHWLRALDEAMRAIGVDAGLAADAAGMQLCELLDSLAADVSAESMLLGSSEFRHWIGRRLEAATFRDSAIESPVVFTSVAAARLRSFDAVVICGADDAHLGEAASPGLFFNQQVRRELGLPGQAQAAREMETALFSLVACVPEACVTWQHTREGEPNLLASVFERLRSLHTLAWGDGLPNRWLADALRAETTHDTAAAPDAASAPPAPRLPAGTLPAKISVSAYNALVVCPYRFFARHVLGLSELDEVQEEVEKVDYGNLVHAILHRFHGECPVVSHLAEEAARETLIRISRAAFSQAIGMSYLDRAWLMQWEALAPQYIEWQREREAQGWRFRAGEVACSVVMETPAGRRFELTGRIDRVDERSGTGVSVVDYKTLAASKLRKQLELAGEDVQLPAYRLLWGADVTEALYLSFDAEEVKSVAPQEDIGELAGEVRARLGAVLDRISAGDPLPAQGTERACAYCNVGGLCRRKHWP